MATTKTAAGKKPEKRPARGKEPGNIVVDLGEDIDGKIRSVVKERLRSAIGESRRAKSDSGQPGSRNEISRGDSGKTGMYGGYKPGGYRPGMFGGYRPWYADKPSGSGLGAGLGMAWLKEPVKPLAMAGGLALGTIGNRALLRVTPDIVKYDSALLHNGIAFLVGLIPVMIKPNSITVGVALPGAVYLFGSFTDWVMNKIGVKQPALSLGSTAPAERPQPRQGPDQSLSARDKLQSLANNMRPPQGQPQQQMSGMPRFVARQTG